MTKDRALFVLETLAVCREQEVKEALRYVRTDLVERPEPVIRCSQCRFYDPQGRRCFLGHAKFVLSTMADEWYCADAKESV